ncbi:MAG: hypothetical protein BalsKO_06630 [Balneolaceae bacterium]
MLYNPFDIAKYAYLLKIKIVMITQGLVFSLSIIFIEWLSPLLNSRFFKKWSIGKAILWYGLVFIFSSFINFIYKSYWNNFIDLNFVEFINVIYSTAIICIPISVLFISAYHFFNRREISKLIENKDISIKMEREESFEIDLNNILYISSNDNYVNIYYLQNHTKKKAMFRSTLKAVEEQIVFPFSPIVRCHRQFLINKHQFNIEKATSRSMTLSLKKFDDKVSVSSTYVEPLKKELI